MMRGTLLYLSGNKGLRHTAENLSLAQRAAQRFVAGTTPQQAITAVGELNQQGMLATLDHLGESVEDEAGARQATQAGNQRLALQSQQLSDLVALLAADGRAGALTEAERAAAAEQGREQRRRFLTPGSGYQPGNAQMFNNGN